MKKIMFKMVTTLITFILVFSVGKKLLVGQAKKMGGDFNKALQYVKEGKYIDAVMAYTGDLGLEENENIDPSAIDEAKEILGEDKNIFESLQNIFSDMEKDIDKIVE